MTTLTKLGEFGLINRFKKSVKLDSSVKKGTGDDCAVIKFNKDSYLLFTCDMLIEGMDFTRRDNPYLVGRKAIAVSLSDIAACAGLPRYCLVALGLPRKTSLTFADKLFKGMRDLAGRYKVNIAGGDLSRAGRLTIDVSMLGKVEKKLLVLRSGAKKGDIIFVSGKLGGSIRGRHLSFIPRVKEARFLVKNFKVNAMIDISDGLLQDLGHILEESRVGAALYEDLIPLSAEARNLGEALYMGEDFELLFTLAPKQAKRLIAAKTPNFKPIGEITRQADRLRIIDNRGREKVIQPRGFRHF
ncbi:MAG: thiamine-phosphate kinase [Candidatus Omnitrophica bacterium]|nr:thiamine-phosphate kinase [Candidatus Omnitrophota bacterium]